MPTPQRTSPTQDDLIKFYERDKDYIQAKAGVFLSNDADVKYADLLAATKARGGTEADLQESLARAYYVSPIFEKRLLRSLGVSSVDGLDEKTKEVYDRAMQLAKEAASPKVSIEKTDLSPHYSEGQVHLPAEERIQQLQTLLSEDVISHEFHHHIYNPSEEAIDPEDLDIPDDAPLNCLADTDVDADKTKATYYPIYDSLPSELESVQQQLKELGESRDIDTLKNVTVDEIKAAALQQETIHDSYGYERAAEVQGARMQMFQDGICNPLKEDVTREQVEQYHELHPNARIFNYWDEEQATFFMNNTAQAQPAAVPLQSSPTTDKTNTPSLSAIASSAFEQMSESSESKGLKLS